MRHLFLSLVATSLFFLAPRTASADEADTDRSWIAAPRPAERPGPWFGCAFVGGAVFMAGYAPAGLVGARSLNSDFWRGFFGTGNESSLSRLVIPVVGAFSYAKHPRGDASWGVESDADIRGAQMLAVASGIAQTTGLVLLAVGLLSDAPHAPKAEPAKPLRPVIEPTVGRGGAGVTLRMGF